MSLHTNSSLSDVCENKQDRGAGLSFTPRDDEESAMPSQEEGKGGETDQYLVDWDGPDDKNNPRNWSNLYKAWITLQLGMLAFAAR